MVTTAHVTVFHTFLAQEPFILLLGGNAAVFLGGQSHATGDVALAATHLDGIGGDDGILVLAQVRHLNDSLVQPLGQREGAQINPYAARHGLVHAEVALAGEAVDGIGHVTGAARQ